MADDLHATGFSSCLWCDLRLNVRRSCTRGSENEFVNVESFSDDVAEVQKDVTDAVAVAETEGTTSQVFALKDIASPEFIEDLERTVQRREDATENLPVVETCEELPEGQDPSPSVAAFNEISVRPIGENCVSREVAVMVGGASKPLLLWNSFKSWMKQEERLLRRKNLN
jgi:hypothetical protein